MTSPLPQPARQSLVSTTSILILSGFLVAAPLADIATEELSPLVIGCGLVGLLAFIGLQIASERREEWNRVTEQKRAHTRLNKHLATPLAPPLALDFDADPLADLLATRSGATSQRSTQSIPTQFP